MRKVLLIILSIMILIGTTGCNRKELNNYKLKVIESSWSGWSKDYKPEEKTTLHDIILDKKYVINKGSLGLTFVIKKINKDSIVIETTEAFSDSKKGIDLNTKKKEFIVEKNKVLELTTPTMDAGGIYYLSLEKK